MGLAEDAVARIDRNELVQLALEICNIDSAGPTEARVAEHITEWLGNEGFRTRKLGLLADRFNVLGTLPGTGGGYSLIFNSHMDTAVRWGDIWRRKNPEADIFHKAWIEGEDLVGEGIVNDKGPMAAFLIAAKAVKATGVPLRGDLKVSGVVAETSREPCEDAPGVVVETKDLGARFLVTHGGVADYALVAEGTGFSIVTVEAGMAWYKITWISEDIGYYTPYLPERTTFEASPSMIVRASVGIQALERWAVDYQRRYSYQAQCGTVVPKAQVGGIRGGAPNNPGGTPQVCSLYLGAFIVPDHDPLELKDEIEDALKAAGVPPSEVELYHYVRGYEAKKAERLQEAVLRAHMATFREAPPPPNPATCSMWRDVNIFNELGIPALTYGPRASGRNWHRSFPIQALYDTACVYARTIVDLCNQEKPKRRERQKLPRT